MRRAELDCVSTQGSVPLPAHLFKAGRISARELVLREAFRCTDALMRARLLPGARLRVVARRPR